MIEIAAPTHMRNKQNNFDNSNLSYRNILANRALIIRVRADAILSAD